MLEKSSNTMNGGSFASVTSLSDATECLSVASVGLGFLSAKPPAVASLPKAPKRATRRSVLTGFALRVTRPQSHASRSFNRKRLILEAHKS